MLDLKKRGVVPEPPMREKRCHPQCPGGEAFCWEEFKSYFVGDLGSDICATYQQWFKIILCHVVVGWCTKKPASTGPS